MIDRRELLTTMGAAAALQTGRRPNILFICTDNFNPNVIGYAGHLLVKTPNIDRLAKEGTWFNNAYCGSPVCAPARASLMTGMFPSDVNSFCNATPFRGQKPTWGHALRSAGYYTKATGKMDLDHRVDLGFEQKETAHGHDSGGDVTALFRPLCYRLGERPDIEGRVLRQEHRDAAVLKVALEFLRDDAPQRSEPWALYVGFVGPLPGFQVERKYAEMYSPDKVTLPDVPARYLENLPQPWEATRAYKRIATPIPDDRMRRAIAAYYGNVTAVDERIGQVLDQLERSKFQEKTVVVLTADHGRSLGEHGLWFHNEPTDHSSRVPLIIAGPGLPKGRRSATPVMHVDLFPTLLEFGQTSVPSGLRGHSLVPVLHGQSGEHPGIAYSELHAEGTCTGSFIIRRGDWKYIHYTWYDSLLFNMKDDPGEMNNVIKTAEGARVAAELHQVLVSLVDPTATTERAFAVQEKILQDLCARMTLEELLGFGFERRLGRAQAITLLKKYKT